MVLDQDIEVEICYDPNTAFTEMILIENQRHSFLSSNSKTDLYADEISELRNILLVTVPALAKTYKSIEQLLDTYLPEEEKE